MKSVANCDPSTTILGFETTLPIFASGAALAKLGHPLGLFIVAANEDAPTQIKGIFQVK